MMVNFLLYFLINFNWRLITLQYCGDFWHTSTWISHGCTRVLRPEPPSHPPYPKMSFLWFQNMYIFVLVVKTTKKNNNKIVLPQKIKFITVIIVVAVTPKTTIINIKFWKTATRSRKQLLIIVIVIVIAIVILFFFFFVVIVVLFITKIINFVNIIQIKCWAHEAKEREKWKE